MTSAADSDAPQLEYGKQPSSRRRWLLAFLVLAAIVAAFATLQLAREPFRRWQARRAYDRQAEAWHAAAAEARIEAEANSRVKWSVVADAPTRNSTQ